MNPQNKSDIIILGRLVPDSGKIHQNQEIYHTGGVICVIKATSYKNPPKILVLAKREGET